MDDAMNAHVALVSCTLYYTVMWDFRWITRNVFQNVDYSEKEMNTILTDLVSHFDQNNNGLIDKSELLLLLNVPDNFLDLFGLYKNLTQGQYNDIFTHYDTDCKFYSCGLAPEIYFSFHHGSDIQKLFSAYCL